jgi:hypothetical protein
LHYVHAFRPLLAIACCSNALHRNSRCQVCKPQQVMQSLSPALTAAAAAAAVCGPAFLHCTGCAPAPPPDLFFILYKVRPCELHAEHGNVFTMGQLTAPQDCSASSISHNTRLILRQAVGTVLEQPNSV